MQIFNFDGPVKSPKNVMPDLIRHPEHVEITGKLGVKSLFFNTPTKILTMNAKSP